MQKTIFIVLLLAGSVGAQSMQSKCAVAGVVVNTISGQPVREAEIELTSLSPSVSDEPTAAYTDADGHFAIENLEPGRYVLQASHDGYTRTKDVSGRRSGTLILAPHQRVENEVVSLMPGGTIAGRVNDDADTPLSGVYVQALRFSYRKGSPELEEAAAISTNQRGEYRLTGLVPGKYYLRATPRRAGAIAAKDQAYVPLYYPAVGEYTRAAELSVGSGEELAGINVSIAPLPAFHIRGRVLDLRSSLAVPRVDVTLLSDEANTFFAPGQTSTDDAGNFDFSGVPAGNFVLVARHAGDENTEAVLWGKKSVVVVDGNAEGVKLMVGPGSTVSGRLRIEGKTHLDVGSLKVTLDSQESAALNSLMPPVETASINSEGSFFLGHVPEGRYSINVFPLPSGFYLAESDGSDELETGLAVRAGHGPLSLNLTVHSAAAVVEGTVLGSGPVAGAAVVMVPDGNRRSQPRYYRRAASNPSGKFSFRGVAPGNYKLFAWDEVEPDAFMNPSFLCEYEDRGLAVHLDPGEHVRAEVGLIARGDSR